MVGEAHSLENAFRAASRTNERLKIRDCSIKCRRFFFLSASHPLAAGARPCVWSLSKRE